MTLRVGTSFSRHCKICKNKHFICALLRPLNFLYVIDKSIRPCEGSTVPWEEQGVWRSKAQVLASVLGYVVLVRSLIYFVFFLSTYYIPDVISH